MSGASRYVLDANIFIEAYQTYYAFDLCPGFWGALKRQHDAGRIFSLEKVKAELMLFDDALNEWAREKAPATFFKGTADKKVFASFSKMSKWVQDQPQFTSTAKAEFSSVADGWVVAYAHANGLSVVTHEELARDVKKKVPIPNLCMEFGIRYCNTFEMLRELNEQFVLKTRTRRT